MTRKHFQALAAALSLTRASLATCEAIAVACEASNPRFDRRRFILACATKAPVTPGCAFCGAPLQNGECSNAIDAQCATKAPEEAMPRTAWDVVS
jgi:hypothetical protein